MLLDQIDQENATGSVDPAAWLDIVPDELVPAGPRRSRLQAGLSVVAAIVSHVGFAALFLLLLQWRDLAIPPDNVIPVEIVTRMPGETSDAGGASGPSGPSSPPSATQPPGSPQATPSASGATPSASASSPPAAGASPPASEAPPPTAAAAPKTVPASPPPPPQLVEPPPEPARATAEPTPGQRPNAAPETPRPAEPKATPPPAEAPQVLSAASGQDLVAPAAPAKPDPDPHSATASSAPAKDPAAELAAALPMDVAALPSSFRAVLSGGGQFHTDDYKGAVFGKLGRSQAASEAARAQHLRGEVLVSFAVDDAGRVVNLKVVRSSGTPAVDALALKMVTDAAPFPPPPPESQRTFTPVLSFGAE